MNGLILITIVGLFTTIPNAFATDMEGNCEPAYPDFCITVGENVDCSDFAVKDIKVLQPDPAGLDRDKDGVGCES